MSGGHLGIELVYAEGEEHREEGDEPDRGEQQRRQGFSPVEGDDSGCDEPQLDCRKERD